MTLDKAFVSTFFCLFYPLVADGIAAFQTGAMVDFHQHEHAVNDSALFVYWSGSVSTANCLFVFHFKISCPDKKGKHSLKEDLEQDCVVVCIYELVVHLLINLGELVSRR